MHRYLDLISETLLLTCSFLVVKSDVGVLTYCGWYIRFPPTVSLFSVNLCFLRSDITYCSHIGWLSVLRFFLVEDELYCVCSRMFFHPWYKLPGSLHIAFVHTGASILTIYVYPNILPVVFRWYGLLSVPLWLYLFWGLCEQGSMCLYVFLFFCSVYFKHIGYSFECCHMVDSLGAWHVILLVRSCSFPTDVTFRCFSHFCYHMGLCFCCIIFFPFNFSDQSEARI